MPLNPVDVYVGSRLKARRIELGISLTKIGKMVGITFQQVQKYEKGLNRIGSSRLYEFAQILKVPVSYFFEEYEAKLDEEGYKKDNKIEKEIMELAKYFSELNNPIIRRNVINLLKSLLDYKIN